MNSCYIAVGFIGAVVLWSVWGHFYSRVEQAEYSVVSSTQDYEIRTYPAHIVVQTVVTGSYQKALNQGFSFSGMRTDARVQSKKQHLLDALKKDNVVVTGAVQYAGYNAPWTPPWMTRHEVLVDVVK